MSVSPGKPMVSVASPPSACLHGNNHLSPYAVSAADTSSLPLTIAPTCTVTTPAHSHAWSSLDKLCLCEWASTHGIGEKSAVATMCSVLLGYHCATGPSMYGDKLNWTCTSEYFAHSPYDCYDTACSKENIGA